MAISNIPVVDHFFKPQTLVQSPDNDETIGVTGRQLIVLLIPCCYHNIVCMALQSLVCIQTLTTR